MLPDKSVLIGQKLAENAKIDKFKCDILGDFQTMWNQIDKAKSILILKVRNLMTDNTLCPGSFFVLLLHWCKRHILSLFPFRNMVIYTIQPCSWQHKRSFWVLENALNNRSSGEPPKQLPTSSIDAATLRVWKEKAFHLSLSSLGIEPIYKIVNNNI